MPKVQFWYEFASTYSYLAAMRIEALAKAAGVAVEWKPFLLGPIFRAQGWENSPFNLYPVKGRYMLRDLARICAERGLPPFRLPEPFPQNSLYAARLALIGAEEGWGPDFARALFQRQFGEGAVLANKAVLEDALRAAGQDAGPQMQRAETQEIKERLKAQTAEAQALGIFGAPTLITQDGELFWGDDRLEQALAWTAKSAVKQ
jgi:2-hydroxychromene-2-carboxylate isomerase